MWDLWRTKWHWGRIFQVFQFPLPIFITPVAPQSSSIIRGWYNRPVMAAVPSGLSLTPLRIIIIRILNGVGDIVAKHLVQIQSFFQDFTILHSAQHL
jgi:hypothetical protein